MQCRFTNKTPNNTSLQNLQTFLLFYLGWQAQNDSGNKRAPKHTASLWLESGFRCWFCSFFLSQFFWTFKGMFKFTWMPWSQNSSFAASQLWFEVSTASGACCSKVFCQLQRSATICSICATLRRSSKGSTWQIPRYNQIKQRFWPNVVPSNVLAFIVCDGQLFLFSRCMSRRNRLCGCGTTNVAASLWTVLSITRTADGNHYQGLRHSCIWPCLVACTSFAIVCRFLQDSALLSCIIQTPHSSC